MKHTTRDRDAEISAHKGSWQLWLAAGALIACAVLLFYLPLVRSFPTPRIASTHPDALEFIWSTWRLEGVLAGEKQLYYSHEVFAPTGASLLLHTICEGVLIPSTAILHALDPIWRYNISLIIVCVLSGWAALSLFTSFGCGPLAATLAAILVLCSPWNVAHLHAGHLNFVALFALLEALRGMTTGMVTRSGITTRNGLRYAAAVTFLCFTNLYYLYFAALLLPAFVLSGIVDAPRSTRERAIAAGNVILPFIIGLLPAAVHLAQVALLARSGTYSADHNPAKHAADLAALLIPSPVQRLGTYEAVTPLRSGITLHAGESSLYLGITLTAAALLACCIGSQKATRRARFFVGLALIFGILSLGPTISWRGVALTYNPFDYITRAVLPLYPSVPARFAGVASLMLIAGATQLLIRPQTARIRALGCGLCIASCLEFLPIPIGVYPLPLPSPTLEQLASDSGATVVADLSTSPQYAMLRQTVHGKPIIGGFLSRHPRQAASLLNRNRFIRAMRGQVSLDTATVINDWCTLSANRLILELPTANARQEQLASLGFTRISSDPYVALFAARDDLCPHNPSGRP